MKFDDFYGILIDQTGNKKKNRKLFSLVWPWYVQVIFNVLMCKSQKSNLAANNCDIANLNFKEGSRE